MLILELETDCFTGVLFVLDEDSEVVVFVVDGDDLPGVWPLEEFVFVFVFELDVTAFGISRVFKFKVGFEFELEFGFEFWFELAPEFGAEFEFGLEAVPVVLE